MMTEPETYPGYRFPAEVIHHGVWLYHVFSLSLRDVELILAERGISVTRESIRQWCLKFGADLAHRLRRCRPKPGTTWYLDEVFLRINGVLHYLWRAVDQMALVGITAIWAIEDTAQLRAGELILIQGGAGGVAGFESSWRNTWGQPWSARRAPPM